MSDLHVETRARSRSKTPFLRSACDNDACAHAGEEGHTHHHERRKTPSKKTPAVQTIIEENTQVASTPDVVLTKKQKAVKTSDYSSSDDPSPDSSTEKRSSRAIDTTTKVTTTTVITRTQKSSAGNSVTASASSTSKSTARKEFAADSFASPSSGNKSKEVSQNELNSAFEKSKIQTSTPIASESSRKLFAEKNGDMNNHIAYKEYREAGEYWKKYPKTDYTYSKLSPHRRELAPGVVAMPNMSRRSLEHHQERINYMVDRDPAQEDYIRRRYEATRYAETRRQGQQLAYDSQDEVDEAQLRSFMDRYRRSDLRSFQSESWWITRVVTTIITTITTYITSVVSGSSEEDLYKTRIAQEETGLIARTRSATTSAILTVFRKIYLGISTVLYWDTCLLQSSKPDNRNKKRFLLLLLILLPLLLLTAWNLLEDNERQAYFQPESILPLSLVSLRNFFSSDWRNLFDFQFSLKSSQKLPSLSENLRKSLSSEEYENILNHVNSYVEQLVSAKLEKERALKKEEASPSISNEMSVLIAEVVRENIVKAAPTLQAERVESNMSYELSDEDIQRIVEAVYLRLRSSDDHLAGQFTLSAGNLEQISNLIKENIEINNHHYNIVQKLDIDELLLRILKSPKLTDFVDSRISVNTVTDNTVKEEIDRQQLVIDQLNDEIEFIKSTLSDKLNENEKLHYSIDALKSGQDELLKRLGRHEASTDERFVSVLAEIDLKLAKLDEEHFSLINKQVKLSLVEVLGYKSSGNIEEIDLQNWVRNMFVAKEFLEERLNALNVQTNEALKAELDRSGMVLMREINEKLKTEILKIVEQKQAEGGSKTSFDEEEIKRIVKSVLAVYDADKTGLVDYALESAGGQILSTRCTENYQTRSAQISVFGIPLWYPSNTPRIAISPNVQPGECWAFQGFPGFLVLQLNSMVFVNGFTMEHIPKSLAPNGRIDSAPRNFTVWGLDRENDQNPVLFGEYEYQDNGAPLQYFAVQNKEINRPYDIVELRIESNHGNLQYTCLYRFRVHGKSSNS